MNDHSVRDWTLTAGIVGGLIGSAWGVIFTPLRPEYGFAFLPYPGLGVIAGLTGGSVMGSCAQHITDLRWRWLVSTLLGAITGLVFGIPIYLLGAFFTTPSGVIGAILTNLLLPHPRLRWIGAAMLSLVMSTYFHAWVWYISSPGR